jgi:hypothetical protein
VALLRHRLPRAGGGRARQPVAARECRRVAAQLGELAHYRSASARSRRGPARLHSAAAKTAADAALAGAR